MKRAIQGYSLIEILVVVSIIGILVTVAIISFSQGSAQSRDAQRKADLRNIQSAIELYKNQNGRYPEACNGAATWSGQRGTSYECSDGTGQYIVGLAPEFIPSLPRDPQLRGNNSGYVYQTNADGTVYKIMARDTVETENISRNPHPFKSCDISGGSTGYCDALIRTGSPPPLCAEPSLGFGNSDNDTVADTVFDRSYSLWGGFAVPTVPPGSGNYERFTERDTQDIVCDMD